MCVQYCKSHRYFIAEITQYNLRQMWGGFGNDIIIDNGMGMGMGMGMGCEQIIIDNYGGGTTTIIENGGMFGNREEVIINNNGYGGYGRTQEIIVNNGYGGFGRTEEIIINNGYGRTQQIIVNNGYGRTEEIIIDNGGYGYGGYGMNEVIICGPNCMKACCINKRKVVGSPPPPVIVNPPSSSPYFANNNQQQVSSYSSLDAYQQQQQDVQSQLYTLVEQSLFVLRFGQWEGPHVHKLTNRSFDKHVLNSVTKLKCRTSYQPFSNALTHDQIVLKAIVGGMDVYYAARSLIIREFFVKTTALKVKRGNIDLQAHFKGELTGMVLKKSEFLGNWEERYLKITETEGLKSYRNPSHNHTLHIKSTKELWTWFQIINGRFLALKLKHNGKKYEFAIPVAQCQIWLQAFFSILEDYQ